MKLFDLHTCNTASEHQKEILYDLDMEVRDAVSRLNSASGRNSEHGETLSMTMLLAIAADVAMACPRAHVPTEDDFAEAAKEAFAWALKRHWNGKSLLAHSTSFTIAN